MSLLPRSPGETVVRRRPADPRLKLAFLAWVSLASVLLDAPAALAGLLAVSLAAAALGLRLPPRGCAAVAGGMLLLVWGTLVSQALFYADVPRTPLFTLWPGLTVYREGVEHGLVQSLRLAAVTLAGLSVALSTSPERLLAALARVRLNAGLAFVVVAALRFLPTLAQEWSTVRLARSLRGRRRRWFGLRGEAALLLPVLAAALRRSQTLATSTAVRGFDPAARRTWHPPLTLQAAERLALALLALSAAALVAVKALYGLYLADLLYVPQLRGLYAAVRQWL